MFFYICIETSDSDYESSLGRSGSELTKPLFAKKAKKGILYALVIYDTDRGSVNYNQSFDDKTLAVMQKSPVGNFHAVSAAMALLVFQFFQLLLLVGFKDCIARNFYKGLFLVHESYGVSLF